ncbi:MAG: hypothetical protein JOZ90_15540 [Alphaproteobacteria bacterium]|nr:hypothetical protein [Alphaproteobacteria bacterium]MBV9371711.1 hypothetical protein [Alphaproteobacteria bacterium]MBV9902487.1 hypothetical protein [Alphaproteobacteria bacterium]
MPDALARFLSDGGRAAEPAIKSGLPVFAAPLGEETTLNSSPYIMSLQRVARAFGRTSRRRGLLDALRGALARAAALGVDSRMILLGGSFVHSEAEPSDIDGLLFYALPEQRSEAGLHRWRRELAGQPLDLQFCPVDVDPLVLVKRAIFFSNHFSYDRQAQGLIRGTVLVPLAIEEGRAA